MTPVIDTTTQEQVNIWLLRRRSPPSLDTTTKSAREPEYIEWLAARRRRRIFHRAMSGMHRKGQYRLITLTTSDEAHAAGKDIQRSFRALVMRLRRRGLCDGYIKVKEFTKRGLAHLHVVVRGRYIPQALLSEMWRDLHDSPIVDVRAVRTHNGMGAYLSKYLGKSEDGRYSWSWDWVWLGFARDWTRVCKVGFSAGRNFPEVLQLWHYVIDWYDEKGVNLARY